MAQQEKGGKVAEMRVEVASGAGSRDRSREVLLVTAQQLHSQGDALVPVPWQDAHISAVERRLKDVVFVNVVVAVTWKDLETEQRPIKTIQVPFKKFNLINNIKSRCGCK